MCLDAGVSPSDVERWVPTASLLHSNGDAVDVAVQGGRIVGVRGSRRDRVNKGRLDVKDRYGWQANRSPDRLTSPLVRRDGRLVEADWDTAMSMVVERSRELLAEPGGSGRIGFYTSGQLFLEEYYTLAVIGKAGIGTPHMDGNTRLCTATAAESLKESFGSDGQPAGYDDVDLCDALALWGHNVAETQQVLWARILDRRAGEDPPAVLAVDPRRTAVAREADLHLAPRPGTNVALLNCLVRQVIAKGWYDSAYVDRHTVGFEKLVATVDPYTAELAAQICDVPERDLEAAAELLGTADRLVSTVLQGLYQSNQATAAACTVNSLHLVRGMIGRPGAGVLQMNGQPSAQNTRETGADGDLPAFRNFDNPEHVAELARVWNVEPERIPSWGPPTHAMQIFRYAEQGSLRMLWISATNPAVSLPDLARIRRILAQPDLFVVAQDIFPTETTELADVVLPAATWAEKTGVVTNADRTVHLCEKAVEPPGTARADLDIFLDYARRMDLHDKEGEPLVHWTDPEGAYRAWQACSRGRPCDYSGITYELLRDRGGVQWPLDASTGTGTARLYADGRFVTEPERTQTFGRDLDTGAFRTREQHAAEQPAGRAFLHAVPYHLSPETPGAGRPLVLTTGRTAWHFHTRTKTGRAPELRGHAPHVWVEVAAEDARSLGLADGDDVVVESARGRIVAPAVLTEQKPGSVFVPFHYGYWDSPDPEEHGTAANELTLTGWDPVSRQPIFKVAAVRLEVRSADGVDDAPG
jgi:ferredoxin-nitrate reductase